MSTRIDAIAAAAYPPPARAQDLEAEPFDPDFSEPHLVNAFTRTSDVAVDQSALASPIEELPDELRPFARTLVRAGLSEGDAARLVLSGASPEEAAAMALHLLSGPVSLAAFGPRATTLSVLGRIAGGERPATGEDVQKLIGMHERLMIVRPDGYLAWAISGKAVEKAGEVKLEDDRLKAGRLDVGRFYASDCGCLRELDESLEIDPLKGIVHELALEHDAVNQVLDGAEDTLVAFAMGVGGLIHDPVRAFRDLAQLPSAITQIMVNSPELWERFRAMPGGDQLRVISQIATTLLSLNSAGSSATTAIRSAAAGARISGTVRCLSLEVVLELRWNLELADVAAAGGALGGAFVLGPGAAAELLDTVELSDTTKAALKRAGRRLSEDGATQARRELPKLAAERKRMLQRFDRLLEDPRLSQRARAALESARRALENNLKPEEMIGALRDQLGIPVRRSGDGRAWQHLQEASDALNSLEDARGSLTRDLARRPVDEIAGLSKDIDAISDFIRRVGAFLEIR